MASIFPDTYSFSSIHRWCLLKKLGEFESLKFQEMLTRIVKFQTDCWMGQHQGPFETGGPQQTHTRPFSVFKPAQKLKQWRNFHAQSFVPEIHANHQASVLRHHRSPASVGRHACLHNAVLPPDGRESRWRHHRNHHLVLHLSFLVSFEIDSSRRRWQRNVQLPTKSSAAVIGSTTQQLVSQQIKAIDIFFRTAKVHGPPDLSANYETWRLEHRKLDSCNRKVWLPTAATQISISRDFRFLRLKISFSEFSLCFLCSFSLEFHTHLFLEMPLIGKIRWHLLLCNV